MGQHVAPAWYGMVWGGLTGPACSTAALLKGPVPSVPRLIPVDAVKGNPLLSPARPVPTAPLASAPPRAEASRSHGIPQVAVGAWEGLHGLQAPAGHADGFAAHGAPVSALGHPFSATTGGLLSSHLPAAASLLHHHAAPHAPGLRGLDVPQVLDQVVGLPFVPPPLHREGDVPAAAVAAAAAAAAGSALRPPRCVPDAANSGALGPRALGKQAGSQQQSAQHGRRGGRGHSSSSVGLNKQIMTANSTAELLALVRAHGAAFDFFNISTAIARVPKLVGPHACGGQVGGWTGALSSRLGAAGDRRGRRRSLSDVAASLHLVPALKLAPFCPAPAKLVPCPRAPLDGHHLQGACG
jgi:hypothetical protein